MSELSHGIQGVTDTHAHLTATAFDDDRDEVIDRARQAGVTTIVCVADGIASSRDCIELATKHEGIWATVGIHPHQAVEAPDDVISVLKPMFDHDRVVAVGETGLDYHYDFSPVQRQQEVFRAQIRLARELNLPLIIHNREADEDVLRILKDEGAHQVGGVLHCFWSSWQVAAAALDLGFYLGVGGPITFKRQEDLKAVLTRVPIDRLVVETDSPYLAPVPYRGKRNEPAYVVNTVQALADILNMDAADVANITTENAQKLFRFA